MRREACEDSCDGDWLENVRCRIRRKSCRTFSSGTKTYLGTIDRYCNRRKVDESGLHKRIDQVDALLVERNIFTAEFLDSIDVQVCKGYSQLVNFFATSVGVSSSGGQIWMDDSFTRNGEFTDFALFLAHHYYHCGIWQRLGTWGFRCEYFQEVLRGGDNTAERNWIEGEAYEFMYNITDCVVDNVNCPSPA